MESDWNRRVRGAEAFEGAYAQRPPWDTGNPQSAIAAAAEAGALQGHVLDAGCGTGEHALMAARLGHTATGVDVVPAAIDQARGKAAERGLAVRFEVGDVLELGALGERYDTVLDSGCFHVLDDEDRAGYVASLAEVVVPGGQVLLLCFSDQVPGDAGPRRISQTEIGEAFADGWTVASIDEARIDVAYGWVEEVHAWLARIVRG